MDDIEYKQHHQVLNFSKFLQEFQPWLSNMKRHPIRRLPNPPHLDIL